MADKDKTIYVAIDDFKLSKPWDAKLAKGAPGALTAALKGLVGKGNVKVGDGKDGYGLTGTIEGPAYDEGKKTLEAKIEFMILKAGDKSIKAPGRSSGKLPDANPRKLDKDAEFLMQEIAKGMAPKVRDTLEKLAKDA